MDDHNAYSRIKKNEMFIPLLDDCVKLNVFSILISLMIL
jgi:hypothetical protein